MRKYFFAAGLLAFAAAMPAAPPWQHGKLVVSANHRFLQHEDGTPFFWLGDTAWALFQRLDRAEVVTYLENRGQKGFNVVQAAALFGRANNKPPFLDGDIARPDVSPDGYWAHVDYVVDQAARKGIYIAILPVWGSFVKNQFVNQRNVRPYAQWLAARYRNRPNIVWVLGGDIKGGDHLEVWRAMGSAIRETDPAHLITYHPFGGTGSSEWFHQEPWLDFNMFQSGHRRYDQVREGQEAVWKGEDNWRFVAEDYGKNPPKPTVDGEPSYENIPQGLHDTKQPYWKAEDCRRYAYWSVFAGALGHTYGDNSVMQMHKPGRGAGAYGPLNYWSEAINDPGAGQMQHLKRLMLSRPYLERVPDPSALAAGDGARYDHIAVTRGAAYLFAYTYTGRPIDLQMGKVTGASVVAWWFSPRDGSARRIGKLRNRGVHRFVPPATPGNGNDWVLVLDDASKGYAAPGRG